MIYATIRRSRKLLAAILLAVLIGYIACLAIFVHRHIVDGHIIVHSHPYSGSADDPGHTHSATQFLTIAQLSLLLMTVATIVMAITPYCRIIVGIGMRDVNIAATTRLLTYGLRAPPTL